MQGVPWTIMSFYAPPLGDFGITRSVCLSVPWRSCLGYRHAGCLQLSHRRPSEMCGLRIGPRTDVDPQRFLDPWTDTDGRIGGETICLRRTAIGGGISSRRSRGETFLEHGQTNKHTQLKTLPVHVGGFCATSPEHQSPILYTA